MRFFRSKNYDLVNSGIKWQIKLFFTLIAFSIIITVIFITQSIVDELIKREQQQIALYGKIFEYFSDFENKDPDDFLFLIDQYTGTITFPVITTHANDEPYEPYEIWSLNINLDNIESPEKRKKYMENKVKEMAVMYPPIVVKDKDGNTLHKFYYTHSDLVVQLRYFPLIAIIIIALFGVIAYIAFSMSRRSEQSKVWVGMAKEAAHQLGTPLSSLLAWIEILKYSKDDPDSIDETINEMQNDINRLNTITTRFSKIGSSAEIETHDISSLMENICQYFEKRLPHLGKKVEIIRTLTEKIPADVNTELFAWVIENLLKNAAESIENKKGRINIYMKLIPEKRIYIYVKDNGKGMTSQVKRQVFQPGFTTKKRGWGLGLSLTKRIVEDYHGGKIYIKETSPGEGTTFVIELPFSKSQYQ
jgi:nitrogen-specific signal transduction histidine kinase